MKKKSESGHCRVVRMPLSLTASQGIEFERNAEVRRTVWNRMLNVKSSSYKICGAKLNYYDLYEHYKTLIHDESLGFMKGAHSQVPQQAIKDLILAFDKFFKKQGGYPKFKKFGSPMTFRIPQKVDVTDGGFVQVPKIGAVKLKDRWIRDKAEPGTWVRGSAPLVGKTDSATFKRDACGKWWATFLLAQEIQESVALEESEVVGIDLGLKTFATLSTGQTIENPRFGRSIEHRLRKAQRVLSRRARMAKASGIKSKRKAKAQRRVATLHHRKADLVRNFIFQTVAWLTRTFRGFVIEDLCVKGMAKTRLAKSVYDACLGGFRRVLEYKTKWKGLHLAVVDRWFPSSKRCHNCGHMNQDLSLSDREWNCAGCAVHHDRDENAALNLFQEGVRMFRESGALSSLQPSPRDTRETQNCSQEILSDHVPWLGSMTARTELLRINSELLAQGSLVL